MKYLHRFQVKAPLSAVADFHGRSINMAAITPPPVRVRIHRAPAILQEGDEIDVTLWLGPLPMRWLLRIEQATPNGFVDRQIAGAFAHWVHHHCFISVDAATTEIVDEIEATPGRHWFWRWISWGMWLSLPVLFRFRAWKTRRLLNKIAIKET
jgi:ligand-binding SRPBCC domain-containing protein